MRIIQAVDTTRVIDSKTSAIIKNAYFFRYFSPWKIKKNDVNNYKIDDLTFRLEWKFYSSDIFSSFPQILTKVGVVNKIKHSWKKKARKCLILEKKYFIVFCVL